MEEFKFLVDEDDALALVTAIENRGWLACSTQYRDIPFEFEGVLPSKLFSDLWMGGILIIFKDNYPFTPIPVRSVEIKSNTKYVISNEGGPFANVRTTPCVQYDADHTLCGSLTVWTQSGFVYPDSNYMLDELEFFRILGEDLYSICEECLSVTVNKWHYFIRESSRILDNPDHWVDRNGTSISTALKRYKR